MTCMKRPFGTHIFVAGLFLGCLHFPEAVAGQVPTTPDPFLPAVTNLSDIEVRLAYEGHGGCVGRCIKYRVVIHGDGVVEYEDLGGEPREPFRRRTIAIDEVVGLVNEFVRARFFEASASYENEPVAIRQGDALHFALRGGVDGPEWDLTLRAGAAVKTVHLYMGFPAELGRLRDLVESIGGPRAWIGKER